MLKSTLLFSLCLAVAGIISLNAQVTITAADFNVVTQDTVTFSEIDTSGIVFPQGGQNQSWSYPNLVTTFTGTQGFGPNVANSPGSSLFPNANILLGGSTSDNFQYWDTSKLEWRGVYYVNQTQPSYDIYSNPRTLHEFPFTYPDTFTDSSVASLVRNNITYTRKSLNTSEIIGYGDLTVPSAYYPEVLLQKYVWDGVSTSPNGGSNDFVTTYYYFWAPGYYFPVLIMQQFYSNQSGNITESKSILLFEGVTYMDLDELSEINDNSLTVFPNPATDKFQVSGLKNQAVYSLIAVNGAIMQQGILEKDNYTVSVDMLPPGNYLLLVEEDGVESVLKIVKH